MNPNNQTPIAQSQYSPGQALPAPGTATYAQAQNLAGANPPSPIAADSLNQGASPITLPPLTLIPQSPASVTPPSSTTPTTDGTVTTTSNDKEGIQSYLASLLGQESQKGATTDALSNQLGIDTKQQQATSDFNAYQQAKIAQTNTINEMRRQSGGTTAGTEQAIAQYQTESNANISNLAIQAQISQGALTDAQNTLKSKLDEQYGTISDQASLLNSLASMENNDLTDSQKIEMQEKADQIKTDSANLQSTESDIGKTLLTNGAPASAFSDLDKIRNQYANGDIDAGDAVSKMYEAASQYSAGQGTTSGVMPTVQMTSNGTPDPTTQQQFLSSIQDPGLRTTIQGLSNYSINPATIATKQYKGSGQLNRQQVLALVQQYDPTYNETQYASRQTLLNNFTSGQYSQNINSLNTAVGHLNDLVKTGSSLGNTGVAPLNFIVNGVKSLAGFGGNIQSAGLNINAATGELASTFKGGGASDNEIKSLGTLTTSSSPSDFKGYIQTGINLLASRLQALQSTYTSGMGKPPASSFISPSNLTQLSNLKNQGYDVNIPGVYYTDPKTFLGANSDNASALASVRQSHPELTPAQALQYTQYLQENGQ